MDSCFFSFWSFSARWLTQRLYGSPQAFSFPHSEGYLQDVLFGEPLFLHQVMLIDVAVCQIHAGIQVSVNHMAADRTDINPVL